MHDVQVKAYTTDAEDEKNTKHLLVTSFRAPRAIRVIVSTSEDEVILAVEDSGKLSEL